MKGQNKRSRDKEKKSDAWQNERKNLKQCIAREALREIKKQKHKRIQRTQKEKNNKRNIGRFPKTEERQGPPN